MTKTKCKAVCSILPEWDDGVSPSDSVHETNGDETPFHNVLPSSHSGRQFTSEGTHFLMAASLIWFEGFKKWGLDTPPVKSNEDGLPGTFVQMFSSMGRMLLGPQGEFLSAVPQVATEDTGGKAAFTMSRDK